MLSPITITAVAATTNLACTGDTTTVTVTVTSAGTPGYVYNQGGVTTATTGPGLDTSTSHTFTGIGAGTHTFTVTDANGCTSNTASIVVTEPANILNPTSSATPPSVPCVGGVTTVSVGASDGALPYAGTGLFQVGAGAHTFTVGDSAGV